MKSFFCFVVTIGICLAGTAQEIVAFNGGNGLYGYKTKQGNVIIQPSYNYAYDFSEGLGRIDVRGKFGFVNEKGSQVIRPKYDNAYEFSEGLAVVNLGATESEMGFGKSGGKYGFIDKSGKEVISLKYDAAYNFSNGLALVIIDNKSGFIDKSGKVVIPLKYDAAYSFKEGFASVNIGAKHGPFGYSGGTWGFIDLNGKEVTPIKYSRTNPFNEGMAMVAIGGDILGGDQKCGFIDKTGKEVISLQFDKAEDFSEGIAAVNKGAKAGGFGNSGGKWGFIDKKGKLIIDHKYDFTGKFKNGICRMEIGEQFASSRDYVLVNSSGKEIVPAGKYKYISNKPMAVLDKEVALFDGLIHVISGEKHGFINKEGKEIIAPKYDYAYNFENGWSLVNIEKRYGYINTQGNEIIPVKYDWPLGKPTNGAIIFGIKRQYGLLNTAGKEILPATYDSIMPPTDGMFMIRKNNLYGFADAKGIILPPKYTNLDFYKEGMARVSVNGKWGYIDKTGKEIIPPKYDDARNFSDGLAAVNNGAKPGTSIGNYVKMEGGLWGYVDKSGKLVIPTIYQIAGAFSDGKAIVRKDGEDIFIDKSSIKNIPVQSSKTGPLVFFKDEVTKKVGFKDQEGNIVVAPKFLVVHSFENGFAPVKMETGYGYINEKGEEVGPFIYDRVFPFNEGLAPVMKKINGEALFGFIDTKGKVVIPLRYQYASIFAEGLASVFINNRNEYIDKTGKVVFKLPEGHKGSYFKDGKAQVNDGNDVIYLINKKGARVE